MPDIILNRKVVLDENLSAKININISNVPTHTGEYYAPPYHIFELPDDFVLIDLQDDKGKIDGYNITEKNRTFTHGNLSQSLTFYKELVFSINDTTRNITSISLVFSSDKTYGNSTPNLFSLNNIGLYVSFPTPAYENTEVFLQNNFFFIPQREDIKDGNYLVSENKNEARISYRENNRSVPGIRPNLIFFKNETKGNWTLLETERYITDIENPSEKEIAEFKIADEFFYILENITGFVSPYKKFVIEVFNSGDLCGDARACAGTAGFTIRRDAISADTMIHESMHAFQQQIRKNVYLEPLVWFDEGTATYAGNLFSELYNKKYSTNYYIPNKPSYESVKEFYLKNNRTVEDVYFLYEYSAFSFHIYVKECGENALKKVFQTLKEIKETKSPYKITTSELVKIMGDACGKEMTEDDIDYPYRDLFLKDENAFREKIKNFVE